MKKNIFMKFRFAVLKRFSGQFLGLIILILSTQLVFSQNNVSATSNDSYSKSDTALNLKKKSFNFFLVGDWGWNGYGNQTDVANQMAKTASRAEPEFIISVGDNFQVNGVRSVNDPLWMTSYENIYKTPGLLVDWYPVLGNHDYKGNPDAEVKYSEISRRWRMPARYYTLVKKVNDSVSARFIFTDTPPMVNSYYKEEEYEKVSTEDTAKELSWLNNVLANAKEQWIFVIGHHPVFSASPKHGNTPELIKKFKPLFDKYNVDFYFCGHDHDMQHLKPVGSKVDYIVTGSGGEVRKTGKDANSIFSLSESGFTLISINGKELTLYFINTKGQIVYSMTKSKK
jgi:tartrate-resistant acid phosphatase type 5